MFAIGVHEATFRVANGYHSALGVVPVAKASITGSTYGLGYMYGSNGRFNAPGHVVSSFDVPYGSGDLVTVRLNLGANTVAFRLNGADVGVAQKIAPGDAYYFAFEADYEGDAVTIVDASF